MFERIKYFSFIVILLVTISSSNHAHASCDEKEVYCSIPGGTRRVNGVDIHRDCWQYKYKMDCMRRSKNDCQKINANKCTYVGEECLESLEEGGLKYCSNMKRKFSCQREISWEEEKTELIKEGGNADGKDMLCAAFCIDGNCDAVKKAAVEKDDDLGEAVGMLNALKESKEGLEGDRLVNLFKGSVESCDVKNLEYTDCCVALGGWGKLLGANCSKTKNLAKKRQDKKCVKIGTFCKSDTIFGCWMKRTTYCCYDSVIGKILNQEAKKQLGLNNGTAQNPNCGGLSLEDIKKVDFSKADFKDFYDAVVIPNIKAPNIHIDAKSNTEAANKIAKEAASLPAERKGFNNNIAKME